jgi:hypothetical protein
MTVPDPADCDLATQSLPSQIEGNMHALFNADHLDLTKLKCALQTDSDAAVKAIRDLMQKAYDDAEDQAADQKATKNLQKAASTFQSLNRNQKIANEFAVALKSIDETNSAKIAGLNADTMTAKRVGMIYSQNLIHTRIISDNLKMCIVFACFAVIIMFLATADVGILPFALAELTVGVLVLVCVGILIARWASNLNRYNMLRQERVFKWEAEEDEDEKKAKSKCNADEGDDGEADQSAAKLLRSYFDSMGDSMKSFVNSAVDSLNTDEEKCACPATDPA